MLKEKLRECVVRQNVASFFGIFFFVFTGGREVCVRVPILSTWRGKKRGQQEDSNEEEAGVGIRGMSSKSIEHLTSVSYFTDGFETSLNLFEFIASSGVDNLPNVLHYPPGILTR